MSSLREPSVSVSKLFSNKGHLHGIPFNSLVATQQTSLRFLLRKQYSFIQLIQLLPSNTCPQAQFSFLTPTLHPLLAPPIIPPRLPHSKLRAYLIRAHKLLVLKYDRPTKTRFQNNDRCEHEARPNLHEADLGITRFLISFRINIDFIFLACVVALGYNCLADLKTPDPYLPVCKREAHDVVDERFCFASVLGNAECVGEKFFDDEEVRCGCECRIEREYRSRPLQTVAWEVELGHGMYCELSAMSR